MADPRPWLTSPSRFSCPTPPISIWPRNISATSRPGCEPAMPFTLQSPGTVNHGAGVIYSLDKTLLRAGMILGLSVSMGMQIE